MNTKDDFTQDDWHRVVSGPMVAGFAVTAADPGGLIGAVQEATATARALQEAEKSTEEGSLIGGVVRAYKTAEARDAVRGSVKEMAKGKSPEEATRAAVERLREIMGLVRQTAPDEAEDYADWLRKVAQDVAEAAKEGGFLGFGGEPVSEAERQTLADIDAALSRATG